MSEALSWQNHLNMVMQKNPNKNHKECMQLASKTFKGNSSALILQASTKRKGGSTRDRTVTSQTNIAFPSPPKQRNSTEQTVKTTLLNLSSTAIELLRLELEYDVLADTDIKLLYSVEKKLTGILEKYESDSDSGDCHTDEY